MLYEDLQYLFVSAVGLAGMTGLLMLFMWLLHKVYRRGVAWRKKRQMQGKAERLHRPELKLSFYFSPPPLNSAETDATELQPL